MATVRPKWSCVCEEPFVNYKVPNSIYKYFYFKTSTIASRRYLWCTVPHPASSPDLNAAAGGISSVTSIPSQGREAVSLYFEATERWSATYRHGPGVGAGGELVPHGWWESVFKGPGLFVLWWDKADVWATHFRTGSSADMSSGCPQREPAHHLTVFSHSPVLHFPLPQFCFLFP